MNWFWKTVHWLQAKEREANLADYLIVLLTAAIVFWGGMTWWEMHDAGQQTERIICADERLAKAMEDSVTQAKSGMDASNAQSKTVLDAAIAQFQLDQRPWVGAITLVLDPQTIQFPAGSNISLLIANTGKTPALRVTYKLAWETQPIGTEPTLEYFKRKEIGSLAVVLPGQTISTNPFPVLAYNANRQNLFVFGVVEYWDVFKKTVHKTKFCYLHYNGRFITHGIYNDAD